MVSLGYIRTAKIQVSYEAALSDNGLCYTVYMDVSYTIQDTSYKRTAGAVTRLCDAQVITKTRL